jgi:hypothetical protein
VVAVLEEHAAKTMAVAASSVPMRVLTMFLLLPVSKVAAPPSETATRATGGGMIPRP